MRGEGKVATGGKAPVGEAVCHLGRVVKGSGWQWRGGVAVLIRAEWERQAQSETVGPRVGWLVAFKWFHNVSLSGVCICGSVGNDGVLVESFVWICAAAPHVRLVHQVVEGLWFGERMECRCCSSGFSCAGEARRVDRHANLHAG